MTKSTNPIFNHRYLIAVGLILFTIMFLVALTLQPTYANEKGTWKLFDDGITYYEDRHEVDWKPDYTEKGIIFEGKKIDCADSKVGYYSGISFNPECLEIIMRSIP